MLCTSTSRHGRVSGEPIDLSNAEVKEVMQMCPDYVDMFHTQRLIEPVHMETSTPERRSSTLVVIWGQ